MKTSASLKKQNEARSAAEAYGTVRLAALSSKTIANGSSPLVVKEILKAMPVNMPLDSEETSQVHRAANAVHGVPEVGYNNYTDTERRAALLEMVKGNLSFKDAANPMGIYGVPKTTLVRDLEKLAVGFKLTKSKELRALYASSTEDAARIEAQIVETVFPTSGPRKYLSPTESCLIGGLADLSTCSGQGTDRIDIAEMAREIVHKKGADMLNIAQNDNERRLAERFMNAPVSKKFARGLAVVQAAPMAEEGTTNGFHKASNISQTRAAAMSPLLDAAMRGKYKTLFDSLYARGIITSPTPEAFRVFSTDEVGIDVYT